MPTAHVLVPGDLLPVGRPLPPDAGDVTCDAYWDTNPSPPPPVDKHLWKHDLAPNFVCGR